MRAMDSWAWQPQKETKSLTLYRSGDPLTNVIGDIAIISVMEGKICSALILSATALNAFAKHKSDIS